MTQILQFFNSIPRLCLKLISKVLLVFEELDLLTTFTGLLFFPRLWESNPMLNLLGGWSLLVLIKIAATLFIVMILERVPRWSRMIWVVPAIAAMPVIWNIIIMAAEIARRA